MRRLAIMLLVVALPHFARAEDPQKRDDALYLIMDVQAAAASGDPQQLYRLLPPIFKYSFGGDDTRDGAMAFYREYPEQLVKLEAILAQGCRKDGEDFYACPPQAAERDVIYLGPRAGFAYDTQAKQWRFTWFVEGD